MVTRVCECGVSFEVEPVMLGGRELFAQVLCEGCVERGLAECEAAAQRERREQRTRVRSAEWEQICPVLYRGTVEERLPEGYRAQANSWGYGPRGVGFVGEAGRGKTRAAFLLLKRMLWAGRSCAAVSSTRLAMLAADQFSDNADVKAYARADMREFRRVDLLLIDDLGKGRMSDRAEMELFDILEVRTSQERPTIWTANASAKELREMMSADRGAPILRRLAEFSEIASV